MKLLVTRLNFPSYRIARHGQFTILFLIPSFSNVEVCAGHLRKADMLVFSKRLSGTALHKCEEIVFELEGCNFHFLSFELHC